MENRLQFNLGKIEWLWVLGTSGRRDLTSLILNEVALPQTDIVSNLGVHLDFAQQHDVHQLHTFLDQEALLSVTHVLAISQIDYCNALYMGLSLKSIQKL